MATAQERLVPVQQTQTVEAGVDASRILAIGAGIVVGSMVGSAFMFRGASLAGAIAGGFLANWWYGDRDEILALAPRPQTYTF